MAYKQRLFWDIIKENIGWSTDGSGGAKKFFGGGFFFLGIIKKKNGFWMAQDIRKNFWRGSPLYIQMSSNKTSISYVS